MNVSKTSPGVVLVTILAGCLTLPLAALHPNHPLGIDPERAYQEGAEGIDNVDLFSGSLSVVIPIGPFTLTNNSNIWHYRTDEKTGEIIARPDWDNTAGLGWRLGWGELYSPTHSYNESDEWLYVDENGSRHSLYPTLHRDDGDDGDVDGRVFYSRDGSYLRMRLSTNNCHAYVEEPDGTSRKLTGSCGPLTTYRLVSMWSPFASEADPDLTITYGLDPDDPHGTDTLRTVTNRYGLTHKIHLTDKMNGDPNDPIHFLEQIITKVDLEAFNGQRAVYTFTYQQFQLDRSCKDDSPSTAPRIPVPHLERIDLPDGTAYSMVENGAFLYENQCRWIDGFLVDDLPGVLNGINLPTGGQIRWDYQRYEFPPGDNSSVFNTGAGVKARTLHSAGTSATPANTIGTWTYKSSSTPSPDPEMHTEVVFPTGDCTKYYFDAIYYVPGGGSPRGFERGLPFVYSEQSGGKYLSSQVHTGNLDNGSCDPATKIRSNYLRFRHDTTPPNGSYPQSEFINTNRQIEASRTVFHDDGNWYVDTEYSDFDGLGNFRRTVETSNLFGFQQRETTIGYNRSNGTYPGTYTALQISEPWVLGVHDSTEVTDAGAVGMQTLRSELKFEDATGFLECTRTYASGTGRGTTDLLFVRSRDARGRIEDERLYGGDLQTLATTGGDCGTVPSQPVYWTSHQYDPLSGGRTKSWPRRPNGSYGSFPTYDVDLEPRTGFVIRQRDTAGFETTYDYDQAFRVVSVTPQEGAAAVYDYINPTSGSQARLVTTYEAPAASGFGGGVNGNPVVLSRSEVVLDDFGRTRLQRRLLPGGVWSEKETSFNARGWVESVSQWGDLTKQTVYSGFDPFGWPTVITPPDGPGHDLVLFYRGERIVQTTSKIALAGGEAPVTKTFLYDGFGQLVRVWEASDPGGGNVATTNSYDVGGRLTEIVTGDTATGKQVRSFDYDGRGFLLSETHPEKGPAGNGIVTYGNYDASGLAQIKVDGPNDLYFSYDYLGRPLDIKDRANGFRLLSSFRWDGGIGLGKGKLHYAKRFNYLDLPWNAAGEEQVTIRQGFAYEGLGGAISRKTTRILWSAADARFKQSFVYDQLGNLQQRNTPYCNLPAACASSGAGTSEALTFTHDQGLLTAVPGWASGITYHASGLRQQITHANGVADHQERDDDFTGRTKRLFTTGVTPGWNSGVMLYDGAGNIKAQGPDAFAYDTVSRLVDASYGGGGTAQSYTYDRWGNITSVAGDTAGMFVPPPDPATNRLTGANYDAAGNMLTAPSPNPTGAYVYDTDNRLVAQAWMRYLYDAFGERTVSIVNVPEEGAVFHLRDLDHRLVSNIRMDEGAWSRERDYVFAGNRLLGRSAPGQQDYHFHLDRLGSVKMTTLADGSFASENEWMPYGERFGHGSTADSLLFAEPHERDFSTDSDYMHARHYWWKLGRFNSPDPVLGNPATPQGLNRYAYVLGNPLNLVDPTGRVPSRYCWDRGEGTPDIVCVDVDDNVDVIGDLPRLDLLPPLRFDYFLFFPNSEPGGPVRGFWRRIPERPTQPQAPVGPLPPPGPLDPITPVPDPTPEQPHLHAEGEYCQTFARPFVISNGKGIWAAWGHAIGDLTGSKVSIPVSPADERTRVQAGGLKIVQRMAGSRRVALSGRTPPRNLGTPVRGGSAGAPGSGSTTVTYACGGE